MEAKIWLAVGFVGQALFASRFVVQWLVSEREKRSTIPTAFWYLSISGGLTLLTYAIYIKEPVFIVGQSFGLLVYLRNIYFLSKERRRQAAQG
jgi:lipid-A-disaccharide synthase-like uncharacterized protein